MAFGSMMGGRTICLCMPCIGFCFQSIGGPQRDKLIAHAHEVSFGEGTKS